MKLTDSIVVLLLTVVTGLVVWPFTDVPHAIAVAVGTLLALVVVCVFVRRRESGRRT